MVGRLIEALDALKIRDRTIVIFTADNGTVSGVTCRMRGHLVDGGKGGLSERGICMPFIVNAPGRVPAGTVTDALVDFSDLFPTFVQLARAPMPENLVLDGHSFADLLLGKANDSTRTWIYSRLGDGRVIRDKRFKLCNDGRLYDLKADPWEEHDGRSWPPCCNHSRPMPRCRFLSAGRPNEQKSTRHNRIEKTRQGLLRDFRYMKGLRRDETRHDSIHGTTLLRFATQVRP